MRNEERMANWMHALEKLEDLEPEWLFRATLRLPQSHIPPQLASLTSISAISANNCTEPPTATN